MRYFSRFYVVASLLLLLYVPTAVSALAVSEVGDNLLCYACAGEALNNCRSGCGDQMRDFIKQMIEEGKTKKEILDYFEAQFGEEILSIPPKRGFNLVAYYAPYVAFLIGLLVAFLFVRKWTASGEKKSLTKKQSEEEKTLMSDDIQKKIASEIEKLEEE